MSQRDEHPESNGQQTDETDETNEHVVLEPAPRWAPSTKIVVGVGLALGALLVLWISRGVFGTLALSGLIAFLLAPLVRFLHQRARIPRGIALIGTYVLVLVLTLILGVLLVGSVVASVRELEAAAAHTPLDSLRIVVGQFGGLSSITRSLARTLRDDGATVISTDEYEATAHAAAANRFGASLYLGFEALSDDRSIVSYFAVPAFESIGGRALADRMVQHLTPAIEVAPILSGMRLPVLRETRMPAVLCSLGPVRSVVDHADAITDAVTAAVRSWTTLPLAETR